MTKQQDVSIFIQHAHVMTSNLQKRPNIIKEFIQLTQIDILYKDLKFWKLKDQKTKVVNSKIWIIIIFM